MTRKSKALSLQGSIEHKWHVPKYSTTHVTRHICPSMRHLHLNIDNMMLVGNFAGRPSMIHNYMNPAAYIHSHHTLQACYCSSSSNNMQLYIHAYMHTCIHAYVPTCIQAYMHTYLHACMHTPTNAYMHTIIHAYMHEPTHAYMHP